MPGEAAAPLEAAPAAGRRAGMIGLIRRASWNLIDQMLSAGTNAALAISVAKIVNDKYLFGAFSSAVLVFNLLIGLERALVGNALGVRHSGLDTEQMRSVARRGLGTIAVLGSVAGGITVGAGALVGGTLGPPLIAIGAMMAPLLIQDTCRMIFFAQARPVLAALNDAVWAVVQFAVIGVLLVEGWATPWALVLAWGAAAAVGVLLALAQLRVVPQLRAALGWCREHADLVGYMLPETLLSSGGLQASTLLVGGIVGEAAVGSFGAASKLLAPLLIVSTAVMTFAVPEISRRKNMPPRIRWWVGLALSAVMAGGSLLYLALLLALPGRVGASMFAASWSGARSVLLPSGLFSAAAGTCLGPALVIIAMGQARKTFRLTVLQAPLVLTLMPLGAGLAGAPGAAWGQFAAQASLIPFWFWTLHRSLAEPVIAVTRPPR